MRFVFVVQVVLVLFAVQFVILGVIFVIKKQIRKFNSSFPPNRSSSSLDDQDLVNGDTADDIFKVPEWFQSKVVREYEQKKVSMQYSVPLSSLPEWASLSFAPLSSVLTEPPNEAVALVSHPALTITSSAVPRLDFVILSNRAIAQHRQSYGLPFVLHNVSGLARTVQLWTDSFLATQLGPNRPVSVERSTSPLFTYYTLQGKVDALGLELLSWTPPQIELPMTYKQFSALLRASTYYGPKPVGKPPSSPTHWHYLTIPAHIGARTPWLMSAFPFFDEARALPPEDPLLLIRPPQPRGEKLFKGVNCRLAQQGVAAAAHFDSHDNWVAVVRGIRRYVLLPPSECSRLHLLPRQHPSARHSALDWSNISSVSSDREFGAARAVEFLLLPGEMLYIPAYWIHYITSLTPSVQCNARFRVPPVAAEVDATNDTQRLIRETVGSRRDIQRCFLSKRTRKEKSPYILRGNDLS